MSSAAATALDFQPIVSSNLESAAYDEDGEAIVVRFKNGTAYRYPNCGPGVYNDFCATFDGKQGRSAGKFLAAQLKPRPYERLDDWK